jgi:hypothetical protein
MEATSARTAAHQTPEALPLCPVCGSSMIVRVAWRDDEVEAIYWGCRRSPVCEGVRRIKSPDAIVPIAHDASSQALFEWERSRDSRQVRDAQLGGLRGLVGRVLANPAPATAEAADPLLTAALEGLVEYGFVILDDRRVSSARAAMDHVLVGPSGIFVVDRKPWSGQISAGANAVYVDGRERSGVIDGVLVAAAALDDTLAHELKPLGTTVHPAVLFDGASNKQFVATVGKVLLGGSRALPKAIRGSAEPILGPETVVRLALAADRLLD